ncbi:MAG: integration host factor subunit alpha [Deltaproteobacteria bacterium RIFOXYD12_FULL_50_9]|nr:MAG: integration host factor subunit alpha [Deltaproteobacteria bacterium RIFOXYD12_FULL_50_9]
MKRSNITRKDLTRIVCEKMGLSQRGASELVDSFFANVKKSLLTEESVKIVQFGTFIVRKKAPRVGRNPRTGETMEIVRRSMVSFKPSKGLRERINE